MAGGGNLFDRKFGPAFLDGVPKCPGVYEFLDLAGDVIYVGKARILRRRLSQYRNARRRARHHKMRLILADAAALRLIPCETDLAALLLENELIQSLRPRFNVAGAFSFLYPLIGLRRESPSELVLAYTTQPDRFPSMSWHGAFRSRWLTRDAFFAAARLLGYVCHREPPSRVSHYPSGRYSRVAGFRRVPGHWADKLEAFLRGESAAFLEDAVYRLVEKARARLESSEVQERLQDLARFYRFEARPLRDALLACGPAGAVMIPQCERDRLFIRKSAI